MRAIIPVAGEGTRLRPHTYTMPKVLMTVAGQPILGHILTELKNVGVDEITLIVGYRGDQVTAYVHEEFNFKVHVVPQQKQLGLGHAIYLAREQLGDDPAMIVLGDTIFQCDLAKVLQGNTNAIGVKEVSDPRRFGVVELEGERIKRFVEKPDDPPSNLAIVGLYYIRDTPLLREALETLILVQNRTTKGEYQLTDALQIMLDNGVDMTTFALDGWFDCGKPETLLETNRVLLKDKSRVIEASGSIIREPVHIADGVEISNSIVGPNVSIAAGVHIENSIVKESIVNKNASVRNAMLTDSLLGDSSLVEGKFQSLNVGDSAQVHFAG